MANTQSAKKAHRVSLRKRKFNLFRKSQVKSSIKSLRVALGTEAKDFSSSLSQAFAALDKAAKSGTIPQARANRKKSRLAKMVTRSTIVQ